MSPKVAIASVTLALVLSAAVLVVFTRPNDAGPRPAPSANTPLTTLDTAQVVALRIEQGQSSWTLSRDPRTDLWLLREGDAPAWPAEASAVRGWLRLLQQAGQAAPRDAGEAQGPLASRIPTSVRIVLADSTEIPLSLEPGLAGRSVLREAVADTIVSRDADGDLAASLAPAALPKWRSPRLLAEVPGAVANLVIESGSRRVELARSRGGWALIHPAAGPANEAKANEALASLASLASARVVAQPPTSASPSMVLRRVTEVPAPTQGAKAILLTESIEVFGAADAQGATRFARALAQWDDGSVAWGPESVVIPVDALATLAAPDPVDFIARPALPIAPPDVARLIATHDAASLLADAPPKPASAPAPRDLIAQRAGQAWTLTQSASPKADHPDRVQSLVDLLLLAPADEVRLGPWGGGEPAGIARVTLQSTSGAALGAVAIGTVERRDPNSPGGNSGKTWVLVRTGSVTRGYDSDAARKLAAWLKDELPPEG